MTEKNTLYFGDNLDILRHHVRDESVDMVYLDPPFKSNQDYNVLFAERNGAQSAAQNMAFEDTWHWDQQSAAAYQEVVEGGGQVSEAMQAFRKLLGTNDMMAYLAMMSPRLVELRRVMKSTASIYLHCDPTASHYLKVLMDAIFHPLNYRNEIVWKRSHAHSSARRYGPIHDTILFYSKSKQYTWTDQRQPYDQAYIDRFFKFDDGDGRGRYWTGDLTGNGVRHGASGKEWRGFDPTTKGRHWMHPPSVLDKLDADRRIYWPKSKQAWPKLKRYLEEAKGVPLQDIVDDISALQTMGGDRNERLGYPTQKPEALLERFILASTSEGETVLDPFCGCGTTIAVAQKLGRRWLGIDITHLAIALMRNRLEGTFGTSVDYEVVGEPVDLAGARELAKTNPYQFQWWIIGRFRGHLVDQKKGADKGIDGKLQFHDEGPNGRTKEVIISVKAGKLLPQHVRDLKGVLSRENAEIGVLISMAEPTRAMREEAATTGFYDSQFGRFPRLQLLTIEDILDGKGIEYPKTAGVNRTYKAAPRTVQKVAEPPTLFDTPPSVSRRKRTRKK